MLKRGTNSANRARDTPLQGIYIPHFGHRKQESQQQHQNYVVCHWQRKQLSKMFTENTFRLPSGTVPWVEIHLRSLPWIMDGKQMKQTGASSHEIWQKEYPMLLNRSWSWLNVVVFQSDLVKGPNVVAWGINFLALCFVPVVVVVPAWMLLT